MMQPFALTLGLLLFLVPLLVPTSTDAAQGSLMQTDAAEGLHQKLFVNVLPLV
jgi:hypothetical protein